MDRFGDKRAEIERKEVSAAAQYPNSWLRMVSEWQCAEEYDRAWLLYSANYLLRTGGVRWAMDPLTLRQRLPSAPKVDVSSLTALDYLVLTHCHADHLDPELLRLMVDFPLDWIIPESMLEALRDLNIQPERLLIVHPLEVLHLGGLTLTPFNGQHWEASLDHPDSRRGVPATGYLAEFNGKRWLFPGDTRTYDTSQLPSFGPVDGLFAHLWLGRGQALHDKLPLLERFGIFCLNLQPQQVVVTHLDEFGRLPGEFWDERHFHAVEEWFYRNARHISIRSARMGDRIEL